MTTLDEEDAAEILADRVREADVSTDEVLAYLAYLAHGDEGVITREREAGADIGTVGSSAGSLRSRVEEALS